MAHQGGPGTSPLIDGSASSGVAILSAVDVGYRRPQSNRMGVFRWYRPPVAAWNKAPLGFGGQLVLLSSAGLCSTATAQTYDSVLLDDLAERRCAEHLGVPYRI